MKFAHTVFALPFALLGYVYALMYTGVEFDWLLLAKMLICMVLARNAAMGFNRWADRRFDAENPRTAGREIPSGVISPRAALVFVVINAAGFVALTATINTLAFALSPVALAVITGYSFTKRFTAWSHIVLGVALAIAPVGAYIVVAGSIAAVPLLFAAIVATWVAGFDILYSMQDAAYDRQHGLHSVPARYTPHTATLISILFHVATAIFVALAGIFIGSTLYWTGAGLFMAMLMMQHFVHRPALFTFLNGTSSIVYAGFAIGGLIF
ncbi:MAG: putative 4-hydroxybenzoate polyprenyltransferase [Rikenellaceae bacterium]|nr:putative 4-hydroxybenzoate polyprenyltransferase [Rikenellaceae bacterium]MCL2692690.1 putative 4-hydroxybenzoate polyprenyltransferase [Rikenellaceae bacterium]